MLRLTDPLQHRSSAVGRVTPLASIVPVFAVHRLGMRNPLSTCLSERKQKKLDPDSRYKVLCSCSGALSLLLSVCWSLVLGWYSEHFLRGWATLPWEPYHHFRNADSSIDLPTRLVPYVTDGCWDPQRNISLPLQRFIQVVPVRNTIAPSVLYPLPSVEQTMYDNR